MEKPGLLPRRSWKKVNKYRIIAICGKSASGKDTLLRQMVQQHPEMREIVSCTTRPPREGEIDGKNYFFLTHDEFAHKAQANEMLEISHFRDWYYGTSLDGVSPTTVNIGVFNPTGIFNLMNDERVDLFVVLVQASDKLRLIRSLNRERNPDVKEIIRRYGTDEADFEWFSQFYEPEYILDTEGLAWYDLEQAGNEIAILARRHWAKETN